MHLCFKFYHIICIFFLIYLLLIIIFSCNNGYFCKANYDILKYLDHHIKAEESTYDGDWIAGLEVSLDFVNNYCKNASGVVSKTIVVFSELGSTSSYEEKYDSLLEKTAETGIQVYFL